MKELLQSQGTFQTEQFFLKLFAMSGLVWHQTLQDTLWLRFKWHAEVGFFFFLAGMNNSQQCAGTYCALVHLQTCLIRTSQFYQEWFNTIRGKKEHESQQQIRRLENICCLFFVLFFLPKTITQSASQQQKNILGESVQRHPRWRGCAFAAGLQHNVSTSDVRLAAQSMRLWERACLMKEKKRDLSSIRSKFKKNATSGRSTACKPKLDF